MPELYNKDGDLVEGALTAEEVAEKIKEAEEAGGGGDDTATEELKTRVEELKTKLEDKEKEITELANEDDKTKNLVNLRKKTEELEGEKKSLEDRLTGLETKLTEGLEGVDKKITENSFNEAVKKLAGDDTELTKKIVFHYNSFKGVPKDAGEMATRLSSSYTLATGSQPKNPLSGGALGGGGAAPNLRPPIGKPSEELKEVGKKLGVTDADWAKHGNKQL